MGKYEFIIALTEHRFLGTVFQPFLIEKKDRFYAVIRMVKPRDFDDPDYIFDPFETELVNIIERYSDERLRKRFSRAASVTEFYSTLKTLSFEKQVTPFIEQCMSQVVSILMLSPVKLYKKDAKYANLYEEDRIEVPPIYARPVYYFERSDTHTRYRLKIFLGNREISLTGRNHKVVSNTPCILFHRNQLLVFEKLKAKRLMPFFEKDYVIVPNTIEEKYYSGFMLNTVRDYEVEASGFSIENAEVEKKAILSIEKDLQNRPGMVVMFAYGDERFPLQSKKEVAVSMEYKNNTYLFRKTVRDKNWEKKIMERITDLGLIENNGYYVLPGASVLDSQNAIFIYINWLNKNKQKLTESGIILEQDKLEKNYFTGSQKLEIQTQAKGDWFDVHAMVHFGKFKIPFIRLKKYILNDIREFELPNGEIAVLPEEWFARYRGLLPFARQKGADMQFDKHHFALLQENIKEADRSVFRKYEELINGRKDKIELPSKLKAKLRSYQEEGYNWMYGLYKNNLGGCLADDMGLGKTLQTLTLLLKLKRMKQEIKIHNPVETRAQLNLFSAESDTEVQGQAASLIVLPTSLVHNWDNEIQKFTPSLKVFKYVGSERKKISNLEQVAAYYDIILTTYGTLRNDRDILSKNEFFYLILDESQSIKNPASKTYKAVMELRAKNRLVITGTPIENSLSDLWSQMNFLNPGLLGNLAFFRRSFITPIEKHANTEQQERLQLMIRPFILRRKKDEVAEDLPPIVEQVRFCPLVGEQRKMYEKEKSIIRNSILASIEEKGMERSSFVVLQGLTKLRQLANHPALLENEVDENSGKFDEIFRMLQNVVAEKHKVLIFSSFVTHLELLKDRIHEENWKYSMLTGQTTKREKVIREFQEDKDNRIFLISLKAGGVGLNLTEADYVFIIDPWWNPAAENQAINRVHRIGQDKHVFVYRFITENSIEEKIQKLKERKSSLADKFINSNNPFQEISKEDILELFK
jgi:superfamily II DNA or RNA helicase